MKRTITSLQGVWARLNYIRELRNPDGTYQHWGLARIHGNAAAEAAMAEVHSELTAQLLQTPLQELMEQLAISADDAGLSSRQLVENLYANERIICPADLKGGSPRHFHSVLVAARLIASNEWVPVKRP